MSHQLKLNILKIFFSIALTSAINLNVSAQRGTNDTLQTFAVIYEGDTIEAKTLQILLLRSHYDEAHMNTNAKWTRLRNAIYVTYPYAKRAGKVMNELNVQLVNVPEQEARKKIIKSREKDLKKWGYVIIRFTNECVFTEIENILLIIKNKVEELQSKSE